MQSFNSWPITVMVTNGARISSKHDCKSRKTLPTIIHTHNDITAELGIAFTTHSGHRRHNLLIKQSILLNKSNAKKGVMHFHRKEQCKSSPHLQPRPLQFYFLHRLHLSLLQSHFLKSEMPFQLLNFMYLCHITHVPIACSMNSYSGSGARNIH